jgi:hypothetical protein
MERFGLKNTAGLVFFAVKNNMIDWRFPMEMSKLSCFWSNLPFYVNFVKKRWAGTEKFLWQWVVASIAL